MGRGVDTTRKKNAKSRFTKGRTKRAVAPCIHRIMEVLEEGSEGL